MKYFHPFLPNDTIDWDLAYSEHILAVIQAHTKSEYESAVRGMLDCLNDPLTKVIVADTGTSTKYDEKYPMSAFIQDSLLLISIRNYADLEYQYCYNFFSSLAPLIIKSKGIIFDFRNRKNYPNGFGINGFFSIIEPSLVHDDLQVPGMQYRYHDGFVPETRSSSGTYSSGFYIQDERIVRGDKKIKSKPIIFISNEASNLPLIALSLQKEGMAEIISVGKTSDAPFSMTTEYNLTEKIKTQIRLNKLPDDQTFIPNHILANNLTDSEIINSAVSFIKNNQSWFLQSASAQANKKEKSFIKAIQVKEASANKYYPNLPDRLLAVSKIWTIINYFFAYKDLMESDWDLVFKKFIPKIVLAEDSLQYHLTIAEMYGYIQDGHGRASSPVLSKYLGTAKPPVCVRYVGNQPVIINIFPDSIYPVRNLNIGDVILEVDGESASNRFKRLAKYLTSSNESALKNYVSAYFLNGNDGTVAKIKVNHNNTIKTVDLPRTDKYNLYFRAHYYYGSFREGKPITYLINDDIGYADLDRLTVDMVEKMFDDFKNTKSIIFDMRGYPKGTGWSIAPHLTGNDEVIAAQCIKNTPMNMGITIADIKYETKTSIYQAIPKAIAPKYNGKTYMLIDERTQSQAEHTGLFLKAANGTMFIGSQTAGANGDVTSFKIPGSIVLNFTGLQVLFPNGNQLQKIGLIPDVQVKPTIKGIIEGKDEVLEKAVDFVTRSNNKSN